jgi:hypothetical protein
MKKRESKSRRGLLKEVLDFQRITTNKRVWIILEINKKWKV